MERVVLEFFFGIKDSLDIVFHFPFYFDLYQKSSTVKNHIKCIFLLNFLIFFGVHSLYLYFITPLSNYLLENSFFPFLLNFIYYLTWVVPFVVISIYLNSKLYLKLAERIRPPNNPKPFNTKLSELIYDYAIIYCLLPSVFLMNLIPYVGFTFSLIFTSWFNSYAIFNYRFVNDGYTVQERINSLEDRWSYFMGFGVPMTLICYPFNFFIGTVIFSLVLPLFLLSSTTLRSHERVSDPLPFRFLIFEYAIWISQKLFPYLRTQAFGQFLINSLNKILA